MNIGQNIKHLRNERSLSLSELARLSGVSKGRLSAIENDSDANPGINSLLSIKNALQVSIRDIVVEKPRCETCQDFMTVIVRCDQCNGRGIHKVLCPDCTEEV